MYKVGSFQDFLHKAPKNLIKKPTHSRFMANDEQQIQQKYAQFQQIQQQIEQINSHLEMLMQQSSEMDISIQALQEIEKTPQHTEILAPLANGIFLKAKLEDSHNLIVNIGSNATVEQKVPQVIELLQRQKNELSQGIVEADALLQELSSEAMRLYKEVEETQKDV